MTMTTTHQPAPVDLLILGTGWTSTFLIPLLKTQSITYGASTTTGRDGTYKFKFNFDPSSSVDKETEKEHLAQYLALPTAKTVLITFPLTGTGASKYLVTNYISTHSPISESENPLFIQLGSSGIWSIPDQSPWVTRHSPYDTTNTRAIAEDELLSLGGCVLNLSGLWGGSRDPRNWVSRVAKDKDELGAKGSLHLVHGDDVARGIVGVHRNAKKARGERWMVTDGMVYDWWSLVMSFHGREEGEPEKSRFEKEVSWVGELMREKDVRALPRSMETLGRCYDTREFWELVGGMPSRFLY